MELGFALGVNIPTAVAGVHLGAGMLFLALGALNATAGEPAGLAVNALIGVLLSVLGVVAARITARR